VLPARAGQRDYRGLQGVGLLILTAAGAVACAESGPQALTACTQSVAVQVTATTRPEVGWTPSCGVHSVTLIQPDTAVFNVPLWSVSGFGSAFGPPLRYGTGPPGTTVVVMTDSLTPGVRYTVYVSRGFRGAPAGGTDSLTFTPN
jgi:hypothetical protein